MNAGGDVADLLQSRPEPSAALAEGLGGDVADLLQSQPAPSAALAEGPTAAEETELTCRTALGVNETAAAGGGGAGHERTSYEASITPIPATGERPDRPLPGIGFYALMIGLGSVAPLAMEIYIPSLPDLVRLRAHGTAGTVAPKARLQCEPFRRCRLQASIRTWEMAR
jgi:hypothetical protein